MIPSSCIFSLISSSFVGLIGLLPLIVFYSGFRKLQLRLEEPLVVSRLLSFAVGCLLGDIFFHLFPESWSNYLVQQRAIRSAQTPLILSDVALGSPPGILVSPGDFSHGSSGWIPGQSPEVWMLFGFLAFFVFEKLFNSISSSFIVKDYSYYPENDSLQIDGLDASNAIVSHKSTGCDLGDEHKCSVMTRINSSVESPLTAGSTVPTCNLRNLSKIRGEMNKDHTTRRTDQTTGYMNLAANFMDNFTHGLAISASYTSRTKMGFLTTCAIFLHEIPHEFGDFAILLKSGFNTWSAIKAQLFTSVGCVLGAAFGLIPTLTSGISAVNDHQSSTYRILSFTSGGFIHIVLVKILPDLMNQKVSLKETITHMTGILIGLSFMYAVASIE